MAKTKKKIKLQNPFGLTGEEKTIDVNIKQANEFWNEYKLEDGSIVRVKPLMVGLKKVVGKTDVEGNPIYQMQIVNVLNVSKASKRKKK